MNILPGRGSKLLGHLLSEFFVDGVVYAAADIGGEPYAAVDGLMPLCAGQAGQVDAADTIAYQPVNEPGIEVVSRSDGTDCAYGRYRKA